MRLTMKAVTWNRFVIEARSSFSRLSSTSLSRHATWSRSVSSSLPRVTTIWASTRSTTPPSQGLGLVTKPTWTTTRQPMTMKATPLLLRPFSSIPGMTPSTAWNTKIVCTLGPASINEDTLEAMINAGMDVCRLNFSHGTHEEHQETFDLVRRLSAKYNHQVAVLCDIQGPKIRTGTMKEAFEIATGDTIRVTPEEHVGDARRIQILYKTLIEDLHKGDVIFINDGTVKLVVVDKDETTQDLICECEAAGKISDRKGCNLPSGNLSVDVVTEKDAKDLAFIAKLNPEFVACSFVGNGDDLRKVRSHLINAGNLDVKLIAKLERPVALENLDDIIEESDAVMVARGDLGVEIEAWDVPKWQKETILRCNRESKPVIVATQMLDSMIENARPSRAEASDVFNAVVDGADAVMLSGETSVGKYPVETVKVMNEIVHVATDHIPKHDPAKFHSSKDVIAEHVCMAVHSFAEQFKATEYNAKIIVLTDTGFAARAIAKYRPSLPILAFSEELRTVRELALCWGVRAHYLPDDVHDRRDRNVERKAVRAVQAACDLGFMAAEDERVVVLMPATGRNAGYMCSVFDVKELSKAGFRI